MKKKKCPYCKEEISFWKQFNSIGPKYGFKCFACGKKIGEPFWINLPLVIIAFGGYFTFEDWFTKHIIIGILCLGILVFIYRFVTTLFVPLVEKE